MVGASELAFRLLCRRYGTQLAYTPMMNSELFAVDPAYRQQEFQCTTEDRPLVAHFSGNNPQTLLAAARHIEEHCDAIDLNLGCPQRVAYAGHFGSYLLGEEDRGTVLSIVRALSANLSIPVFVKIRLLDSVPDTIELCTQLRDAGASLIAVHARYRVNLVERSGPGARCPINENPPTKLMRMYLKLPQGTDRPTLTRLYPSEIDHHRYLPLRTSSWP